MVEEYLDLWLEAGIAITGTNDEVMLGTWEYQCFAKGDKLAWANVYSDSGSARANEWI